METAVLDKKVEEAKEQKCFWEVAGVDAEGNIMVKVFNANRQKELNALTGKAKGQYTRERNKAMKQDDNYAELIDILGFDATIEMFSSAGKSYVYNVKREMVKDAKQKQNTQAMQDGRQANRAPSETTAKIEKQVMVISEEGVW